MGSSNGVPPGGGALADAVAHRPADPLIATVTGPGGTGKTLLLDALADRWHAAGFPVLRAGPGVPVPADPTGPVLVDDAHRLDAGALEGLRALADVPGARLVLAHRPWPRPAALAAFTAEVGARRRVAVVAHLDRGAVGERLSLTMGAPAPDGLAAWVHDRSGGLPALVDLVVQTLLDAGRVDPRRPDRFRAPERLTVSVALAERLRHRVDALPAPVQELLTALAHGAPLDHDVLAGLLGHETLVDTVEAARATGLLTADGELIPVIAELFLRLTPVLTGRDLHRRLAAVELDRGGSVLGVGRRLLGTGATGAGVAAVLHAAAGEADDPALTAQLLGAAVAAGHPRSEVAGRRALALVLAGELGPALQEADVVLADPAAPGRPAALTAAAVALAHRGLPERAVELLRSDPATAALAGPTLAMLGRVDEARALPEPAGMTVRDGALGLFGSAAVAAATGCPTAAARLARLTTMLDPAAATTALPDTPAALTAVVALLSGRRDLAESTLRLAIETRHGGRVAVVRHRLLLGWVLLARLASSPRQPSSTRQPSRAGTRALEPRDALLAAGLDVALARRRDEGLDDAWAAARDALTRQPVDLTLTPVLAELAVAAAQLGEGFWVAGPLAELDAILDRLGRPALWTVPLDWARLQTALITGDDLRKPAAALAAAAGSSPYAAVLARAGAAWVAVRDGTATPDDVLAVARRMGAAGLGVEAAQLAGAAATGAERRPAQQLHALARSLTGQGRPEEDQPAEVVAEPELAAPRPTADPALTDRERELGRLLLEGMTYKQVGQRLYISAKTVEHYVARMRQRTGATTRDELFAILARAR